MNYKDFLKIGKKCGMASLKSGNDVYLFYDKKYTIFCAAHYDLKLKKCFVSYNIKYYEHNNYVPNDVREIHTNEDLIKGITNFQLECKKAKMEFELSKIKKDFE